MMELICAFSVCFRGGRGPFLNTETARKKERKSTDWEPQTKSALSSPASGPGMWWIERSSRIEGFAGLQARTTTRSMVMSPESKSFATSDPFDPRSQEHILPVEPL